MGWLPERLPAALEPVWSIDTSSRGLGGVAATADAVLFSDRGLGDTLDEWKCVSADAGKERWTHAYPCRGNLDYGNSPRATPLIDGGRVFVLGAFGHLGCLRLDSGEPVWELDLREEFGPNGDPKWGACSSPLLCDGKLIVNPGARGASVVALDPATGRVVWKAPGRAAGYGSLLAGTFGGVLQVVGHDADSLGGWDAATGRRLWTVTPPAPDDFNVPTPLDLGGRLLVSTENNGTRLFRFGAGGVIDPKPAAVSRRLAPDTHTPVAAGGRVFGVWRRLLCLDAAGGLKPLWESDAPAFARYAALVATESRVLAATLEGEFVLFDGGAAGFRELGRVKLLPGEKGLYSHPAFVGTRAYVRGGSALARFDLG